jgi:glutamyl/glutaminyl-tRNA synthetase
VPVPQFAHLPMIHNEKGQKISKRRDPVAVTLYQACGLQPEGFFNFLALLGWSPGDNREVLTKEEMTSAFSFDRINKSPAQFALKRKGDPAPEATDEQRVQWLNDSLPGSKIEWMSGEYLKKMPAADALKAAKPFLTAAGYALDGRDEAWLLGVMKLGQERARTYKQLADAVRLFFVVPQGYDEKAVEKFIRKNDGLNVLKAIRDLVAATEWDGEKLKVALEGFATTRTMKFGDVAQPIRVALAGAAVSPPIHDTLFLLGKDECLRRMDAALTKLG